MSSQNSTSKSFVRAARVAAASLLALFVLSATAPHGALSSSSACAMACCAGKPAHLAGDCDSVSCHVNIPPAKSEAAPEPEGADAHAHHAEPARAGDESASAEDPHAHAAHADGHPRATNADDRQHAARADEQRHASHASAAGVHAGDGRAAPGDDDGAKASRREQAGVRGPEGGARGAPSLTRASMSEPCPAECGAAAGSSGVRVKPKDAPLAQSYSPRPPPLACADEHTPNLSAASDTRRGNSRPRAPPQTPAN
jgi:hypothetical protein